MAAREAQKPRESKAFPKAVDDALARKHAAGNVGQKINPYVPPSSEIFDVQRFRTISRRTWNDHVVVALTLIQYFFGVILACVVLLYKDDEMLTSLSVVAAIIVIPPGVSLIALRRRGSTAYYVSMLTSLFSMWFMLGASGDPNPILSPVAVVAYVTSIFAWRAGKQYRSEVRALA